MMWHIWWGTLVVVGLHHSLSLASSVLYHGVLYSVLVLLSTTPWPRLAADVTCVTSRNLLPLPPASRIVTMGALNLQNWILTDQIYKWTCMMTGQESERPIKSQGQQLFTSRLQPTRVEVRYVDSRDGHRTLCRTAHARWSCPSDC